MHGATQGGEGHLSSQRGFPGGDGHGRIKITSLQTKERMGYEFDTQIQVAGRGIPDARLALPRKPDVLSGPDALRNAHPVRFGLSCGRATQGDLPFATVRCLFQGQGQTGFPIGARLVPCPSLRPPSGLAPALPGDPKSCSKKLLNPLLPENRKSSVPPRSNQTSS